MNKREKLFIQNNFHEVLHTTFNPNGPGVVRLHLIPSNNCSNEHELSTKDWKLVIDKCKSIGISQLTFTGGEPTMRDDLPELIQHARWFITRLNTNGVLLSEEYCRRLKASEVDNIQITFYSHDKNIHNKLVGADNYDKTVDGIKNALSTGISVSINTPLCTLNQNYKETLQFLHNFGVLYVTCSGLIITGNATNEISKRTQLTQKELLQTLTDAVNYCNDNKMELSFTSPGWLKEEDIRELGLMVPSCGACLSNMAITPSGMVVPCQSWLSDEPLGNFLQDDWSSIWKSHRCQSVKENSRKMLQSCPLKAKEDKQL